MLRANPALVRLNGYAERPSCSPRCATSRRNGMSTRGRRAAFRGLLETQGRVEGLVSEIYRHRSRERIWVSENAHPVHDAQGRLLCYEGTVEEVTERMHTQQALERSEAQLRLISTQMPGVVYPGACDAGRRGQLSLHQRRHARRSTA
jgi:PAS domain-containing protein